MKTAQPVAPAGCVLSARTGPCAMRGEPGARRRTVDACAAASLAYFSRPSFETHDFGDSNYGIAIREHIEIRFRFYADSRIAENTACYVRVNDIHALRADLAGRIDVGEIVETPWGMDELYVHDPGGSLVKFGQATDRFIPANTVAGR